MKTFYTIGLIFISLMISQQTFPQKENAKGPLTGEQQIELSEGYSFVSSRIIPDDPDMLIVMASVLSENLDFIRNSQGAVLRKIGPNWVNGIGDWIVDEGYLTKMFTGDSFIIGGDAVNTATPIPVTTGFQFVSYFPETPLDALIAFETIIGDDLDFIRDSQGSVLRKIGPNWVNGIGDCNTGEGYLVKMNNDDELVYPSSSFTCGEPLTDPRDGQTYNTIQIGNQCWMSQNLNYGTYLASTGSGSLTHDDGIVEKYCWNNIPSNCDNSTTHPGGFYEFYEAVQYYGGQPTQPVQGACPEGWHMPAKTEFTELISYLGGTSVAGTKLKVGGSSGFEGVIAGWRCTSGGSFLTLFPKGFWWSSTQSNSSNAWYMDIDNTNPYATLSSYGKSLGFNIRCVKD